MIRTRAACASSCWLVAVLLWATACGGSEEATPGGYSDVCSKNEDCEEGLECANGVCTGLCGTSADCAKFSGNSVCVNRCFEFCTDSIPCKRLHPSLQCVQFNANMGTCKVQ